MSAPTVKLHGDKFNELIMRRGRQVKWQEAIVCSCWNLDSGSATYGCNACKGIGHVYTPPKTDVAVVQSIAHSKSFDDMAGVFEMGDAVMTVGKIIPGVNPISGFPDVRQPGRLNPLYHIGMYDIVTLTDDEYKTSEILVKGTDIYSRPADTLLNEDVVEVLTVRKSDPVTGAVTVFEAGTDYMVVGNRLDWLETGEPPSEGEQYSVQYTHRPVFIVLTQLPTQRYQDGQDLPRHVALRYRAGGFDRQ